MNLESLGADTSACSGLTVEHFGNIDQARERLARFVGTRPDGVLVLDKKSRVTDVDAGAADVLGLDVQEVLGGKVFGCFPDRLKDDVVDLIEMPGEQRGFTLAGRKELIVLAIEIDAGQAIGVWLGEVKERRAEIGTETVGVFRRFASARDLPEVVDAAASVGLILEPSSAGAILVPVQGALVTVGCWPMGSDSLTKPICRFESLPDSDLVLAGQVCGLVSGVAEVDLAVSSVYRRGHLACVLVTSLNQKWSDELARWVADSLARI